jgi:hypothetical protein
VPGFVVVQQREYRKHLIDVTDRGKAGCAVVVRPPSSMGEAWEVPHQAGTAVTLAERLNRAKALIDAVMGPRPARHPRQGVQRGR